MKEKARCNTYTVQRISKTKKAFRSSLQAYCYKLECVRGVDIASIPCIKGYMSPKLSRNVQSSDLAFKEQIVAH